MAPHFRQLKARLRQLLTDPVLARTELATWPPKPLMNALLACLPQPDLREAAAEELGCAVNRLAETSPEGYEEAKVFMRRLMWHMNEESGNIGWGVPEAFGAILAQNRRLARDFHRILLSYITSTGHHDNFCDHAELRLSCYAAVGVFIAAWPDYREMVRPLLEAGSRADENPACRELAASLLEGNAMKPPAGNS